MFPSCTSHAAAEAVCCWCCQGTRSPSPRKLRRRRQRMHPPLRCPPSSRPRCHRSCCCVLRARAGATRNTQPKPRAAKCICILSAEPCKPAPWRPHPPQDRGRMKVNAGEVLNFNSSSRIRGCPNFFVANTCVLADPFAASVQASAHSRNRIDGRRGGTLCFARAEGTLDRPACRS